MPGDTRVDEKEQEKVDKYPNLVWELRRLWNVNTNIIPIVVGALTTPTRRPASADRTACRQFQATGQPVSRTQACDVTAAAL